MLYLLAFVLIFLFVLLLPLKIIISAKDKKTIKFKIAGVTIYKREIGLKDKSTSKRTAEEKVNDADKKSIKISEKIKFYFELSKLASKLAKKYISIESISVSVEVGTSDAPSTAVCTGVLWGSIYRLLGVLGSIVYIKKNSVDVKPDFNKTVFSLNGECIIKSRLVYIIFIVMIIFNKIKSLKGKED